jgi:hypothetical protein
MLDVHHIVPFRLTQDNRQVNLLPLCKRCHKVVECVLNDVLAVGVRPFDLLLALGSILRERQLATFMTLRRIRQVEQEL